MTAIPSQLESAVLETVVFFDLFDYPLTSFELWQSMPRLKISFEEFATALDENKFLDKQNGFYFLKGREKILDERQKNYREALQKVKIARRFIRYLRLIPFVKGVALCNSLGYFNARSTDDIDLFILVKPRRLWLTRGLAVLLAELLAARPSSDKTRNAVCLSFFAAENANLASLKLQPNDLSSCPSGREDPYFDWWLTKLFPIYGTDDVWQKFFARNDWIDHQHPNFFPAQPARRFIVSPSIFPISIRIDIGNILNFIEKIARFLQWKLMPAKIKVLANQDTRVVLNDEVLKFHTDDRREWYREEWKRVIQRLSFRT